MENSSYHRIARIIAFIDEIWSLIDFLYTFITFFGGEVGDGLFYQVELHADLGLPPDQVTGKKALTGLLFFITLIYNLIWVFAGYMLFKGTETTAPCPVLYRKKLQYCRVWFSASFLLLLVPGINMFIYLTDSLLEIILAMSAFLTRGVFMYLVLKYMLQLQKGPCHSPHIQTVLYAPPRQTSSQRPQEPDDNDNGSEETTPFNPTKPSQGHPPNSDQGRGGKPSQSHSQNNHQGRSPKKSSSNSITNSPKKSTNGKSAPKTNGSGNNRLAKDTMVTLTSTTTKTTKTKTKTMGAEQVEIEIEMDIDKSGQESESEDDGLVNSSPNLRLNPMFA